MEINKVAYIGESNFCYLSRYSIDVLFGATYVANDPKLLVDITEHTGLTGLDMTPPWGDDLKVFSDHVILNFIKILIGWMGIQFKTDLKYGAWLMKDLTTVRRDCRENAFELNMCNAHLIYDCNDGYALYMYSDIPEITRSINPDFRIVK